MDSNYIAFFSSDAEQLYLADIYRVLSLPKGYRIQFRYEKKLVSQSILDEINNNKETKKGIIYFVSGNNQYTEKSQRKLKFFPIREIEISDSDKDEALGNINFYLKLGEFCNPKELSESDLGNSNNEDIPPNKFVSKLDDSNYNNIVRGNTKWLDVVKTVERHFAPKLFYFIEELKNDDIIHPTYENKNCYYELEDEMNYQMKISFYLSEVEKLDQELQIQESGKKPQVKKSRKLFIKGENNIINCQNEFIIGAKTDTRTIEITINAIPIRTLYQKKVFVVEQIGEEIIEDYFCSFDFKVKKSVLKKHRIGLYSISLITGVSILGISLRSENLYSMEPDYLKIILFFISLGFIYYASSNLYHVFDKK